MLNGLVLPSDQCDATSRSRPSCDVSSDGYEEAGYLDSVDMHNTSYFICFVVYLIHLIVQTKHSSSVTDLNLSTD